MEVNAISEDINMDEPRGRSLSSSPNEHRLIQIPYVDRMEAQNNDPSWFNQTEQEYFQLSYATPKEGVPNVQNEANNSSNTPLPHVEDTNNNNVNMDQPHGFDSSFILCEEA